MDNQTYKTDILTGQKLKIGNASETCSFVQYKPGSGTKIDNDGNTITDYRDIPVILLATEEIEINSEAIFPGDTYAEMRITDCGSHNRMASNEQFQISELIQQQRKNADSINTIVTDSLIKSYIKNYVDSVSSGYNAVDACQLTISPNPALNFIRIDFKNSYCFDNIKAIYLIDINGREFEMKKETLIDIEGFSKGTYLIKVIMEDGTVKNNKIIKT